MSDDPLDGAAIGETRSVTRTKTIHMIDIEPPEFYVLDRQRDVRIADVDVVIDEHGDEDLRITWEADLTRRLPPRWDQCNEPRTERERRSATRSKWLRRITMALAIFVPVGFAGAVGTWLTLMAFDGSWTINGQPATAPSAPTMAAMVAFIIGMVAIIFWAVRKMPPMGGATRP